MLTLFNLLFVINNLRELCMALNHAFCLVIGFDFMKTSRIVPLFLARQSGSILDSLDLEPRHGSNTEISTKSDFFA
jgi:hypothetical protein